jgi:hypothetical protein
VEETERGLEEPARTAVGEITEKRHPILLAIVFIFALWLLALPFLFFTEKSSFSEAVRMFDRICEARKTGETSALRPLLSSKSAQVSDMELAKFVKNLPCPNRLESKVTFQRLKKHFVEDTDTYELTVGAQRMFFILEEDALKWMLQGESR